MTPEQIAENVKRLRNLQSDYARGGVTMQAYLSSLAEAIQTINALVQLVGEMHDVLKAYGQPDDYLNVQETLTKAAPIAQLAKDK